MVSIAALNVTLGVLLALMVVVVIHGAAVGAFADWRSLVMATRRWRREARDRSLLATLGAVSELPGWVGGDARCWHDNCSLVVVRNHQCDPVEVESWLEHCGCCGAQRGAPPATSRSVEWAGGDVECAHPGATQSVRLDHSTYPSTVEKWSERCVWCGAERGAEATSTASLTWLPAWAERDAARTQAEWAQLEEADAASSTAGHNEEIKERNTAIAERASRLSRAAAEAILVDVATVREGLSCGLPVDQCGVCSRDELGFYDHLLSIEGPAARQRLAELDAIRSIAP